MAMRSLLNVSTTISKHTLSMSAPPIWAPRWNCSQATQPCFVRYALYALDSWRHDISFHVHGGGGGEGGGKGVKNANKPSVSVLCITSVHDFPSDRLIIILVIFTTSKKFFFIYLYKSILYCNSFKAKLIISICDVVKLCQKEKKRSQCNVI